MDDTSNAIHPDRVGGKEECPFRDIGNVKEYKIHSSSIQIECEHGYVEVRFLSEKMVRIIMNPIKQPSLSSSIGVIKKQPSFPCNIQDLGDIFIESTQLLIVLTKAPFRVTIIDKTDGKVLLEEREQGIMVNRKQEIMCTKKMGSQDLFYGFGEKTGFLNKCGEKLVMWNSDVYAPHNPETDPLYQSIPFYITLREGKAHGVFIDNTYKMKFDLQSSMEEYSFSIDGGQLDYYFFVGPTIKSVIEQYTDLTGRMGLPPKWTLGYHQSRYSYKTEKEVRNIVHHFEIKNIPLDAIYLDIHYMDDYRVFTFNTERFSNAKELILELKEKGIQLVTIVDPGVKVDAEYSIYQEGVLNDYFCKYLEGEIYQGNVWPGKSAFPDFPNSQVRDWWGQKHDFYLKLGVAGIWNDMN